MRKEEHVIPREIQNFIIKEAIQLAGGFVGSGFVSGCDFLVVLCTDPLGNNGCGPSESMMTSGDAPETADSDVSQSNDASSDTAADTSDQTSGSTATTRRQARIGVCFW